MAAGLAATIAALEQRVALLEQRLDDAERARLPELKGEAALAETERMIAARAGARRAG